MTFKNAATNKSVLRTRAGLVDIARGSALACAVIQDELVTTKSIKVRDEAAMKAMLHRVVAMRTRMAMKLDAVAESSAGYDAENDNEHRSAEHESQAEETQEPSHAPKRLCKHLKPTSCPAVGDAGVMPLRLEVHP